MNSEYHWNSWNQSQRIDNAVYEQIYVEYNWTKEFEIQLILLST